MEALILLFRLKTRGSMRQWWQSFKTPEGAIRGLFSIAFFALLLVPLFFGILNSNEPVPEKIISPTRRTINNIMPLMVALCCWIALSVPASGKGLNFQRPEIDLLFSGPFSRNELLIYKLLDIFAGTLAIGIAATVFLSGLFLFIGGNIFFNLLRGYLAVTSAILLFRLLFIWSGLIRKSIAIRLLTPLMRTLAIVGGVLMLIGVLSLRNKIDVSQFNDSDAAAKMVAIASSFLETDAVQYGLMPFRIFSHLILSQSVSMTVVWSLLCLAANALVVFGIMKTDENFLEKELSNSRAKAEQVKRTASVQASMVSDGPTRSFPMLPYWGGLGPTTWRQLQTFYRMKFAMIWTMVIYLGMYLLIILTSGDSNSTLFQINLMAVVLAMMTLSFPLTVPLGFETDYDKMEIFKSLPLSKWQIAAGQLLGPLLILTAIQYLIIAVCICLTGEKLGLWFAIAAFLPLLATLVLSVVNTLALLYPRPPNHGVVREFENVGHVLVFTFLVLSTGIAVSAALACVGGLAYYLTENVAVILAACWLVMLGASAVGVWSTGWAFARFDVSKHQL